MIKIILPFVIPSVNHLYWHKNNIKILKTKARELREHIKEEVGMQVIGNKIEELVLKKLIVNVVCYNGWFFKNGKVKKKDILNKEKFLMDSVFKGLQQFDESLDDKFIWKSTFEKGELKDGQESYTAITIEPYSDELMLG